MMKTVTTNVAIILILTVHLIVERMIWIGISSFKYTKNEDVENTKRNGI